MCADVATPRPGLQLVWTGPRGPGEPRNEIPSQPSPPPLGPPPAVSLSSSCRRSGPLCGAGGGFSGAGRGLGESPCLAAPPADVGRHLPVLFLLRALWTLAPRGLPSPPVLLLLLLLRLLGPVAETLILIRFRSLCGLQAEAERVAQGTPHPAQSRAARATDMLPTFLLSSSDPGSRAGRPCLPRQHPTAGLSLLMVRESLRAGLCLPQSLELPGAKVVSHPIKPGPPKNRLCLFHESKVPQELGWASPSVQGSLRAGLCFLHQSGAF